MAEAERHAAQFRPVWDVDEAAVEEAPAPAAAAPAATAAVPAGKPTMRWAPGATPPPGPAAPVTQASPAFVPPAPAAAPAAAPVVLPPAPVVAAPVAAPLPAPATRGKQARAQAPAPEMLDLAGDEAPQISSDGSVALAVVTGPVAVPRAANVAPMQGEPSIVVNDVATMARELAAEARVSEESEARRRQTVRADDPALQVLQAQYDQQRQQAAAEQEAAAVVPERAASNRALRAARTIAPSAGLTSSMVRAAAAPLPGMAADEDNPFASPKKNRTLVFGVLGVAGLLALLGMVKLAMSGDDPATGVPTAAEVKPGDKPAAADAPTAPAATTAAPTATTATTQGRPTPTLNPSQLPTDGTPAVAVVSKRPSGGTATPAAPATAAPAATTAAKKPGGKSNIVRDVPF